MYIKNHGFFQNEFIILIIINLVSYYVILINLYCVGHFKRNISFYFRRIASLKSELETERIEKEEALKR